MRIKKISTMFAVAVCGLMIGAGVNNTSANAAENKIERRPVIEFKDAKTGEDRVRFLDTNHVDGATWDEDSKTLTLDNFENRGSIYLDYFKQDDYSDSAKKKEKKNHEDDLIKVVVKGKCKVGATLHCDCRLKIEGKGKNASLITNTNIATDDRKYPVCNVVLPGALTVQNLKVKDLYFSTYNIKFKKVDLERTFRPCFDDTNNDGKKDEIDYEVFANAKNHIWIVNSNMNFKYVAPTKEQLKKYSDKEWSYCFWAEKLYKIENSNIIFNGSKAFKNVTVKPFDGNLDMKFVKKNSHIEYKVGQVLHNKDGFYVVTKTGDNRKVRWRDGQGEKPEHSSAKLNGYWFKIEK